VKLVALLTLDCLLGRHESRLEVVARWATIGIAIEMIYVVIAAGVDRRGPSTIEAHFAFWGWAIYAAIMVMWAKQRWKFPT
jgi:hypothetical protein